MAFQSGLLEQLPPGVRAPRCYGVMENEAGAWVWIEYIQEATGKQWSLDYFQRTAAVRPFQSAYLVEPAAQPTLAQRLSSASAGRTEWLARFYGLSSNKMPEEPIVRCTELIAEVASAAADLGKPD
jgi:hypothetical protein